MAKDPAFLFYSSDFIMGCSTMTHEEVGQYIRILCYMHQKGRMKEDTIRFLVGSVSVSVSEKFIVDDGGYWYNVRLEQEVEKRRNFIESRRNNGKMGGKKPLAKPNGLPTGIPTANLSPPLTEDENDNVNEDVNTNVINVDFEFFWKEYDKKVGDKEKIKKKWLRLTEDERELIMSYIPKYKQSQPDKVFRKNPETFLNNHGWLDEIIKKQTNGSYQQNNGHNGHKPGTSEARTTALKGWGLGGAE
jgi:hypothetical protein